MGAIISLVPHYFPIPENFVEMDIANLRRNGHTDYFFLARREKCWLFDYANVYTPGSYANLTWTYGQIMPHLPAAAFALHVDQFKDGCPWGSVTILDYQKSILDVEQFSLLPPAQRERHIRLMVRRFLRNTQYCSIREVIEYLKTGEVK